MKEHHIRLTSSEIGGLWANYISDSLFICVYRYFLAKVEDKETQAILKHALDLSYQHVKVITNIFKEEGHAIPQGFTDEDVNVDSPRLFSDEFFLIYTKQMTKGALATYGVVLPHTFRKDIREHFMSCIASTMELFNETTDLLLTRGLEIRSPYIPYLEEVDMVETQGFLAGWLGKQRPLMAAEITHLYSNIQTNHLASALLTGFGQVVHCADLKGYMKRGKNITKKHIEIFTSYLQDNALPSPHNWDDLVLPIKETPFSDKLMMYHTSLISAAGVGNYGTALSASLRRDIAADYTRFFGEIGLFAEDGLNLLINNAWFERPPHAIDSH
ncbi:DUF3231 family protein (plasmid) [Niallia circulans]|uniref:DUF3231 family protein n=1 Tax=Niallia circulans TaxID=1397 RepID=A0A553SQP9_NIACI|nr:DUF3231 family protein [Niallia circulans]TRZ39309.1 DUF3231 family protein [Niallia circulans]